MKPSLSSEGLRRLGGKKRLAVLFGGKSAEHEISILTAIQAIHALDPRLYEMVPVYVAPTGEWFTGDALLDKTIYRNFAKYRQHLKRVTLLPDPQNKGLKVLSAGYLSWKAMIPIDVALILFHGQQGEDGPTQGLFELAEIPYTGPRLAASAIAMDKALCKELFQVRGIPTLPHFVANKQEAMHDVLALCDRILQQKGLEKFPLFIKPVHLGSSIGISKAQNIQQLTVALAKAFQYDYQAIVEPSIENLMEINVSVLGWRSPRASVVEIPVSSDGQVLTYEDKYLRGGKKLGFSSEGMASLARLIDPPHFDPSIKKQVQEYALDGFKAIDGSGVCRFDFMMDLNQGQLYFNELNVIPGSLSFYLWEQSHPRLLYTELLNQLIQEALEIDSQRLSIQKDIGFHAL